MVITLSSGKSFCNFGKFASSFGKLLRKFSILTRLIKEKRAFFYFARSYGRGDRT